MEKHQTHGKEDPVPAPVPTPSPVAVAEGNLLGAMQQQLIDHEDGPPQAVVGGEGGGGLRGTMEKLFALGDRHLQAAIFFLVWGYCVLINATVLNPVANVKHKFVGFVVLTTDVWLALLTLAGAGAGRTAARAERFLRGLFF